MKYQSFRYYQHVDSVPDNLRFDVPPQNAGQTVEVAYSDYPPGRSPATRGALYKRVTDSNLPVGHKHRVTFFKTVEVRPEEKVEMSALEALEVLSEPSSGIDDVEAASVVLGGRS